MRSRVTFFCISLLSLTVGGSVRAADAIGECTCALNARREAVNTVVARLRLTLHNRVKKQDYVLNGAYLGDAAGNLRLRITSEGGQLLLDMGARGESVEICIPDKEQFVSGTRDEMLKAPQSQMALLAHCGRARELFFPQPPRAAGRPVQSCRVDYKAYFNVRRQTAAGRPVARRTVLDLAKNVVEKICLYTSTGADAGRVVYSDYRPAGELPGTIYPRRIALLVPGGEYTLDIDVDDLTLNSPIAASKFVLQVPAEYKRQSFAEALAAKLAIWE